MIRIAREKNGECYEVADIRNYTTEKRFDAVISPFHVMSYQNENEDIKNAFLSARKILNKGGLFLFDTWYGPGVLTDPPAVRVKKGETEDFEILRVANPVIHANRNVVDVNYVFFDLA